MGITGWTYPHIRAMPTPEFWHALGARGRMLRPWVQMLLDVKRVEGLSDKSYDGQPSSVQKTLDNWHRRKAGEDIPQTPEDARFGRAAAILLAPYYGDPDANQTGTEPFPGMSAEEAKAIIWWVNEGLCPPDVWARELIHVWDGIVAAAG